MEGLRDQRARGATCKHQQGTGAKSWTLRTDLDIWLKALQGERMGARPEIPFPKALPCPLPFFSLLPAHLCSALPRPPSHLSVLPYLSLAQICPRHTPLPQPWTHP